jgi:hypothetical protein
MINKSVYWFVGGDPIIIGIVFGWNWNYVLNMNMWMMKK